MGETTGFMGAFLASPNAANWLLIIVVAVIGMVVQWRLQAVFRKYSRVPLGVTGRQVAERMLRESGITDVRVISTPGRLTDHFDPRNKTVNLSEAVYGSASIAAAAVAAHECGHAVQHAMGYAPLKMRSALVPLISATSRWVMWVILAGMIMINTFPQLIWVGIAMLGCALLFSLVTLPVEFNASKRAMEWLGGSGIVHGEEYAGARTTLSWAASTYVVAALSSLVTIIYYIGIARGRD